MIVTDTKEAYRLLLLALSDAQWVKIMTYNAWIPPYGYVRDFFGKLTVSNIPTKMIVGTDHPTKCIGRCKEIARWYPTINIVVRKNLHAKGVLMSNGMSMIGSMNVCDSTYIEMAIVEMLSPEDFARFNMVFDTLWED